MGKRFTVKIKTHINEMFFHLIFVNGNLHLNVWYSWDLEIVMNSGPNRVLIS